MKNVIDFYFDFSSPYAYFASMEIDELAKKHGLSVHWHPILLGAIFKKTGAKPLLQTPLKGDYAHHDLERIARKKRLPFTLPVNFPFAALAACRAFYWIRREDDNLAISFAKNIFKAGYQMRLDISDPKTVIDLSSALGLDSGRIEPALSSETIKEELRNEVSLAEQRGVFGSPFFIFEDEHFWGHDRMATLDEWLSHKGW
jgi:2-hydroxychromene-2-carboxylate isomerase